MLLITYNNFLPLNLDFRVIECQCSVINKCENLITSENQFHADTYLHPVDKCKVNKFFPFDCLKLLKNRLHAVENIRPL